MAALLLSAAGAAVGGAVFGPAGAFAGRIAGALGGNALDRALFPDAAIQRSHEGPRLSDLDVMTSSEGAPVARAYGRVRLSGQVIWATNLEELISTRTETSGGGGKGGGGGGGGATVTTTTTTYSYFANLALGLCEGPIGHVSRVWADGKPLDLAGLTYRVHSGVEAQMPDPLIVAKEGGANAPAYRGLAYIVFERLPLAAFGNRIPQLSFEVVRAVSALERKIRAVTLIPGATEFGYEPATVVQVMGPGQSAPENRHVAYAASDVVASLDELQSVCPNLENVAVVVTWFGDDLRAGECRVRPGIDNREKSTHGATWSVAGETRAGSYLVSTVEGRAAYGGTPSDSSVVNLIGELKARGLKVTLYPFLMMDIPAGNARIDPRTGTAPQPVHPWRGDVTCDPAPGRPGSPDGTGAAADQIEAFFNRDGAGGWNYRRMVLHYAGLAAGAGGVDAFLIGSELKALTRVRSASGVYPAVGQLMSLAAAVKAILGAETIVTYGADWTEYGAHVVDAAASEVRFPLDPLWASPAIDVVGIDYYAPLSDWRDTPGHLDRTLATAIHDRDYLRANLAGGEAFDFYYADAAARASQSRTPITDGLGKPWMFRQKDIWSFWSNLHYERVDGVELSSPTAWIAQGKPIWLTEFGCPAVDKGSNQPNVFPDQKSSSGGYPYFSNRRRDDLIQRRYLETILTAFEAGGALNPVSAVYDGPMVDPAGLCIWTWDARPYPAFPSALDVWSDGVNWETGHWLTGRLGSSQLDGLVSTILSDAGIGDCDASALGAGPDGYLIDRPMTARAAIEPLARAYAFEGSETGGVLTFRPRGGLPVAELDEDDLVLPDHGAPARLVRAQETDLPREVSIGFTDGGADYRRAAAVSRRLVGGAARTIHTELAIVTDDAAAIRRAEVWLQDLWAGRERAEFALPPSALALSPGDVLGLSVGGRRRLYEIADIVDTASRAVSARSIDPEVFDIPLPPAHRRAPALPPAIGPVHVLAFDLPSIDVQDPPVLTRLAIFAEPWPGPVAIWRSADGLSFERLGIALAPAIVGETLDDLPRGPTSRWDNMSRIRVRLYGGALASVSDNLMLGGANAAAVRRGDGAWEVLQFAQADLVADRTYMLSRFLRGQGGSEWAMGDPLPAGASFVLLDEHVVGVARGLDALERPIRLRVVAAGRDHGDVAAAALDMTPAAVALRPLAPVHPRAQRVTEGIRLGWVRRSRIDADSWAAQEIPLGEVAERYIVDIRAGDETLRSLETAAPQALYSAADELADFGTPQSHLDVRITQISATVGRGIPLDVTLQL
ncbi:MAG: glycoside hydrolase TIM-barrel-like domain-containing protein [Pseudorhodoplanes sp.]|nr:glycoside hydrolase TIM-barrel-like domain-containing protein [Pseudorhodoplanes sp.]